MGGVPQTQPEGVPGEAPAPHWASAVGAQRGTRAGSASRGFPICKVGLAQLIPSVGEGEGRVT